MPKKYQYEACQKSDNDCFEEGIDEELLQWNNLFLILIVNLGISNFGQYVSILAWALAAILYFFPALAVTPSNKIDVQNPTSKGIPLQTIYGSVKKIEKEPLNPVVVFFESYILLLDFCHSLSYLLEYVMEYVTFQQSSFPSVAYPGRNGVDLSGDLFQLAGMI